MPAPTTITSAVVAEPVAADGSVEASAASLSVARGPSSSAQAADALERGELQHTAAAHVIGRGGPVVELHGRR